MPYLSLAGRKIPRATKPLPSSKNAGGSGTLPVWSNWFSKSDRENDLPLPLVLKVTVTVSRIATSGTPSAADPRKEVFAEDWFPAVMSENVMV